MEYIILNTRYKFLITENCSQLNILIQKVKNPKMKEDKENNKIYTKNKNKKIDNN